VGSPDTDNIPLEQLLNRLPAPDSTEARLVFNAIFEYGEEGILQICRYLEKSEQKIQIQAEFALNGIAVYVSDPRREDLRLIYISGISKVLEFDLSIKNKILIINNLKIVAKEESVPLLGSYINDPKLYEPAIQALIAIGSNSAGQTLYEALPSVDERIKLSVIRALGVIRFTPATEDLLKALNDPDEQIQEVSVFALSNMGVKEALIPIQSLLESNQGYISDYIRLAETCAKKGDLETAHKICWEILEGDYPENHKIAALNIQVKYHHQEAINLLFLFASNPNKNLRIAAINLVKDYNQSDYVQPLIKLSRDSEPDIQSDILDLFRDQNCTAARSYIMESLASPSRKVRITALRALSEFDPQNSVPELVTVLKDSLDEYETIQIQNILTTISDSKSIEIILDSLYEYPPHSKFIILGVLNEKYVTGNGSDADGNLALGYIGHYLTSLQSENRDVRLISLAGLEHIGDDTVLEEMILFLLDPKNEREQTQAIQTIKSILKRSTAKKENHSLLDRHYEKTSIDNKIVLLNLFRSVGGTEFLDKTVNEVYQNDENLQTSAVRALGDWPDDHALEKLIAISNTHQNEKFRIIAQRGALRILSENPMGEQRALRYYSEIMKSDLRPEEKRQILAGLSKIRTVSSLESIASFLNDPLVSREAQVALVTFSELEIEKPQPPDGFISLFNGENLDGWKGLVENPVKRAQMSTKELQLAQFRADSLMKEHWHVVDGVLYFDGGGSHLCTVGEYTDFELYVDWKIEKKGDSGIYLRGSPQIQIWDPNLWPEGSGGLYNNQKHLASPLKRADNPIGEWNRFHIIMRGNVVTVYLNDTLVVDQVEMENFWERDKPIYPRGQIELQSHFTPLYFKNIYIRELKPRLPLYTGRLFNGTDLEGWQVIGNSADTWKVKNGTLSTDSKGGGWISTKDQYKDFELELEYRLPEEGNSGVFIRTLQQGDPWITGIEIQLLDDGASIHSQLKSWQYTGSLYGIQGPDEPKSKKAGEWQKMNIVCEGPVIKVSLNGELINHVNLIDYMDMEGVNPGIKRRSGYIGLQNHDTKAEFRNIKIREIAN
jgi:HEAT repeat protein